MSDKIKITFPPLPPGADRWEAFAAIPVYTAPPDERTWYQRAFYRVLLELSHRVEAVDDWLFIWREWYAPPRSMETAARHYRLQASSDG